MRLRPRNIFRKMVVANIVNKVPANAYVMMHFESSITPSTSKMMPLKELDPTSTQPRIVIEKADYFHERVIVRLDKAKAPVSNEKSSKTPTLLNLANFVRLLRVYMPGDTVRPCFNYCFHAICSR